MAGESIPISIYITVNACLTGQDKRRSVPRTTFLSPRSFDIVYVLLPIKEKGQKKRKKKERKKKSWQSLRDRSIYVGLTYVLG